MLKNVVHYGHVLFIGRVGYVRRREAALQVDMEEHFTIFGDGLDDGDFVA